MIGRYAACTPPGLAVTAGLLLLMQQLVDGDADLSPIVDRPPPVLVFRAPPPPPPQPPDAMPRRLPAPAPIPDGGLYVPLSPDESVVIGLPRYTGLLPPETWVPDDLARSDTPLVTLVRVEPDYPAAASRDGREGSVTVRFDVLADGSVANAAVVSSSDRVFESAALKAVQRFRFQPRVVDGQPIDSRGVHTVFRFEMRQDRR